MEQGRCRSLYDVERRRLVPVHEDYVWHINAVLEGGDPDEGLTAWLAGEEILTWDETPFADSPTGSLDLRSCGPDLGWVSWENGAVHCRLPDETLSDELLASSYLGEPGSMVIFHLDLDRFASTGSLERLLATGLEWGDRTHRDVVFALSGRLDSLRRLPAELLADPAIRARMTGCPVPRPDGGPRPSEAASLERSLRSLTEALGPRLTVHAELGARDRLRDLWSWARSVAVERLDTTRVEEHDQASGFDLANEAIDYRHDLQQVCEEMFLACEEKHDRPLLFVPVMRVVQKQLAASSRGPRPAIVALIRDGQPVRFQATLDGAPQRLEEAPAGDLDPCEDRQPEATLHEPCGTCWARHLCAASAYGGASEGRRRPRADFCDVWRMEVDAGLVLYLRLRSEDPEDLLGFPRGFVGEPAAASPAVAPFRLSGRLLSALELRPVS